MSRASQCVWARGRCEERGGKVMIEGGVVVVVGNG